eukprot:1145219-Pelagomonas_calceolata.AAC.4
MDHRFRRSRCLASFLKILGHQQSTGQSGVLSTTKHTPMHALAFHDVMSHASKCQVSFGGQASYASSQLEKDSMGAGGVFEKRGCRQHRMSAASI